MTERIRNLLGVTVTLALIACGGPTDPGLPEPEEGEDPDPTENSEEDPGTALRVPGGDGPVLVALDHRLV